MTNGDKIRSMTDDELARWLWSYIYKHQAVGCVAQVILHADLGIMDYENG